MSILVKEISLKSGFRDFLALPSEIYRDDPNWIAPQNSELRRILNQDRNPYFRNASLKIYVCYSDGKPVCRCIMVINLLHWSKWNKRSAFFGFFESLNNSKAVRLMFGKIGSDCRESGAEFLEGPFNPNHYSELGILTDNFNSSPLFFDTYNPSYYLTLLEDAGFTQSCRFHTRINNNISSTLSSKYKISVNHDFRGDITVRKFNVFRFKRDLGILRNINNDAFENNKFFLPLSLKEYMFSAKYLFLVTRPSLILIAEYKGEPVGAVQLVVNFNSLLKGYKGRIMPWNLPSILLKRRNIKELIIFSAGIKKDFRNKRVFAMLLKSSIKIFRNYSAISTTWVSDEGLGESLASLLGMTPGKHFVIFSKPL
jgi:hypothetical protein